MHLRTIKIEIYVDLQDLYLIGETWVYLRNWESPN